MKIATIDRVQGWVLRAVLSTPVGPPLSDEARNKAVAVGLRYLADQLEKLANQRAGSTITIAFTQDDKVDLKLELE